MSWEWIISAEPLCVLAVLSYCRRRAVAVVSWSCRCRHNLYSGRVHASAGHPPAGRHKQVSAIQCSVYRSPSGRLAIPARRPPDKMPPNWFFTMRMLTCQTNEYNFHNFIARTSSYNVSGPFACDVLSPRRWNSIFWSFDDSLKWLYKNKAKWAK